jgi:hypothetical protein
MTPFIAPLASSVLIAAASSGEWPISGAASTISTPGWVGEARVTHRKESKGTSLVTSRPRTSR